MVPRTARQGLARCRECSGDAHGQTLVLASETDAMPQTTIVFYKEADGEVPVLTGSAHCDDATGAPTRLASPGPRPGHAGHELRRPEADYLRDGIYECGYRGQVEYRLLYCLPWPAPGGTDARAG